MGVAETPTFVQFHGLVVDDSVVQSDSTVILEALGIRQFELYGLRSL